MRLAAGALGETTLSQTSRSCFRTFPPTVALLGAALIAAAFARDAAAGYFVSTRGNDGDAGTFSRPWRTIRRGLTALTPGDTLYLRGGTYFERTTVRVSGAPGAPIVIRSYPGENAILDSGVPEFRQPDNRDWELVDAALGEYRSMRTYTIDEHLYAQVAGIPGYVNGRVVLVPYESAAAFRATSDRYVDASTPFYVGPGTFWDPADSRIHVRLAKTADLSATEARYGPIFAGERPDPRRYSIVLSHAYATLRVEASWLTFLDLTVNQALNSVYVTNGAHDLVFDGMTVWLGDSAIELIGASNVTIRRSRIYGDAPNWIFWSDMKDAPAPANRLRSTSIDLRQGTHHVEIDRCHVRGSAQDLIGTGTNEYEVSVHHCRLENATDDAFELEGTIGVGRIAIYENYILNCLTAVAPGQDTPSFTGPLLVYRNVIAQLRNPPVNRKEGLNSWNGGARYGNEYMFKHGAGVGDTSANAHYYQNTMILLNSNGKGLNWTPKNPTDCRIANNIAVLVNGVVNRDYRPAPGEVVDGNLYWKVNTVDTAPLLASYPTVEAFHQATGFEARGIGATPRRGTDPRFAGLVLEVLDRTASAWTLAPESETPAMTDFLLRADSPAIGAGIAIPPHPVWGALPDSRASRDIGAIPATAARSDYEGFPFDPSATADVTPPARPVIRIRTP